jgi:hypothetical protein
MADIEFVIFVTQTVSVVGLLHANRIEDWRFACGCLPK